MASITPILRKNKKKKDGKCPLAIRITANRKSIFLFIGHFIEEQYWDNESKKVKKSHPNSMRLNNLITLKIAEGEKTIIEADTKGRTIEKGKLQKAVQGKTDKSSTFAAVAKEHLDNLKLKKKFSRLSTDTSQLRNFVKFAKNENIGFEAIDLVMINRYFSHLLSIGLSENSAMNNIVLIRLMFNNAIKSRIVEQQYYPFGRAGFQIKKTESIKIGLEREEIETIKNLDLELGSTIWRSRSIFLTSFYMAGARMADVLGLKWSDIHDNRIYYVMGKNKKAGSIKVAEPLEEIFNYYRSQKKAGDVFVFPDMRGTDEKSAEAIHNKVRYLNKKVNKYLRKIALLAKIEKPLSMHIARHSFGNLSGDRIPIQMLQKLYRHSHVTTTINYQVAFMNQDTDDALDEVIK